MAKRIEFKSASDSERAIRSFSSAETVTLLILLKKCGSSVVIVKPVELDSIGITAVQQ